MIYSVNFILSILFMQQSLSSAGEELTSIAWLMGNLIAISTSSGRIQVRLSVNCLLVLFASKIFISLNPNHSLFCHPLIRSTKTRRSSQIWKFQRKGTVCLLSWPGQEALWQPEGEGLCTSSTPLTINRRKSEYETRLLT